MPRRKDALYCGEVCKEAARRMRTKEREKVVTFEIKQRRQEEGLVAIALLEQHQSAAVSLYETAKRHGHDIKFMGSRICVLALEGRQSTPESILWLRDQMRPWRRVETKSEEITDLLNVHTQYGKYPAIEAERDFRMALARGATNVTVFLDDCAEQVMEDADHQHALATLSGWALAAAVWPRSDEIEFDPWDVEHDWNDSGGWPYGNVPKFYSDGFQVIDSKKR
jgi:hypothetical protein